jgi:IclR family transcriptional regulator, pca regulon regulatory protein
MPGANQSRKPAAKRATKTLKSAGGARGTQPAASATTAATPSEEIQAHGGDPNFMTSLARGLAVIGAFSEERRHMTIGLASQKTGIPRAAVRRCLYTLGQLGYVGADDGRNFSLRPKILALGHTYLSSEPLVTSAQPLLDRIGNTLLESCSMAVLDGDDMLYVARSSRTTRIMSIDLHIGSRLPAYCTSMGRVLLAGLPDEELAAFLRRVDLRALTPRTIVSPAKLKQVLGNVRRRGYALVDQELELGLRSIAVPVKGAAGKVLAALNISAQASRVPSAEMEAQFLPVLRAAAQELSLLEIGSGRP